MSNEAAAAATTATTAAAAAATAAKPNSSHSCPPSPSYPVTLSFNTTEPHVIVPVDPVVVPAGARKPSPRDVRILVDGSGAGKTVLVAEAEEGRGREGDKR